MRALKILGYVVAGLVGLLLLVFAGLQTPPGQRAAVGLINRMAPGIEVAGLSGFFPTDLQIAHIAVSDRQGPWLAVDNALLRWSFGSLLGGRLLIEDLAADRVAVLRSPVPDEEKPSSKKGGGLQLPVGIDLRRLAIRDLHLAAALAEVDSHWRLSGNALLPADLAAGHLVLDGERTDGPEGNLAADIRFDVGRRTVDGTLSLTEKRGGIVAVLLQRPDIEDLSLRLTAQGDEQSGRAELSVSAADAARATGQARWQPKDGATAVSVQLDTAGPGLPQGRVADVMRAAIRLTAEATVDEKMATLGAARLTAGTLTLEASGRYDRVADRLQGTLTVSAPDPGPLTSLAGSVTWRGLRVEAKSDLANVVKRPQGTVTLKGGAEDLSLSGIDARVPPIGSVTLAATLDVAADKITARSLEIATPLATVKATGSYATATEVGEAKANVMIPSLAPLSALAGRPLGGSAGFDLMGSTDRDGYAFGWRGTVADATAEGLPGGIVTTPLTLSGAGTWRHDETWTLSGVRAEIQGNTFGVSGRGRAETGDLDLTLDLPKLDVLQSGVTGSARLTGGIKLGGDRTDVRLAAELNDLRRGPLSSGRLTVSANGSLDAAGATSGDVKASGDLVGQPLSLDGRFALDAAGGLVVPTFQGRWASAILDVENFAVTSGRTSGHARLKVARLADAAALAGTELAGSLNMEVTTDDGAPGGRLTAHVKGNDLRAGTLGVGEFELRSTVDDPMAAATADSKLTANRIAGVADINRLTATVRGDRQALVVSLQAAGGQTNANVEAKVDLTSDDIVIGLQRLDARYTGIPVALAGPTRVHVAGSRIAIEPTNLRLGGGRLSVRGTLASSGSDLQLELAALPLSLIDSIAPGTNLDGTLQAKVRMQGSTDAPVVDGTYGVTGLRLRQPQAALVPAIAVQGSASLMGQQASIDARLSSGGATALTVKGKATLPRGAAPLSGSAALSGTIDLAPFAPSLGNDIRNVTGRLRPNLNVEIAGSRVTGNGTIDFSNGAVAMPESGLRLSGGEGRLSLQGDVLQIQRLSFQAPQGGSVAVSGTLRIDPQQGVVPDLTVTSTRALLVSRPDLAATVSSDLKITGSTATEIDVTGPITIDRAEIAVGGQTAAAFPTIDVREVNKPGGVQGTPVASTKPQPRKPPPPPGATPVRLQITINAPQAIFVRGRGLDAEMSGKLDVAGTPAAPTVVGGLTMRRGEFNLLGRRLNFSRGVVTLDNLDRIDPQLDFVASTTVQSTTINVTIAGTSREPVITVSSIPSLPPDEAMALLLFGKPTSALSVFELAQAAQGLAELTGNPSGTGTLGRLRGVLGLDRLSVGSGRGADSSVSLEAGRYVAPGVYVGARQGAAGNSSRGVVQVEVLDHVKIEGDVGADSNGKVGVKMEWDY